jgi:2',3'-cyclic-nucleotide 2'-phosphodiesterase/3'-nucleotidase
MNREALIAWIRERGTLSRARDASDRAWRFVPLRTRGDVTYTTASAKLELARAAGIDGLRLLRDHGDGLSTYAVDLSSGR